MNDHSSEVHGAAAVLFKRSVADHGAAVARLDDSHLAALNRLVADVIAAWNRGGRLLVCGNGGSAADAQHIAAELVGRFRDDRPAMAAMALTTNASTVTAVANDYGFEHVFARQVEGLGRPGDVLLVISTSGDSPNCIAAVGAARVRGMKVHGFLGRGGGSLLELVDDAFVAPTDDTPRIQELHILMGHLLCEILETSQQSR